MISIIDTTVSHLFVRLFVMLMPEKILVKTSEVWLDDEIVFFKINQPVIDLPLLKQLQIVRSELCNGKALVDFHDMSEVIYATSEVRNYYADPANGKFVKAGAVLIKSKVVETIANYYLKFSKSIIPTRFFFSEEEALKWLSQYK